MSACPKCGQSVSEVARFCEQCGASVDDDTSSDLTNRIRDLLAANRKIEAIRVLREATGVGLAEAKKLVESVESGSVNSIPVPQSGQFSEGLDEELLALLKSSGKIQAIKRHREQTGYGLRESKEYMERLAAEHGIAPEKTGCLTVLFMGLLVLTCATFAVACNLDRETPYPALKAPQNSLGHSMP